MTIVHHLNKDGSFVCGDTDTRVTCYAYPTSENAERAKRAPSKVAYEALKLENAIRVEARPFHKMTDYDARNWSQLAHLPGAEAWRVWDKE